MSKPPKSAELNSIQIELDKQTSEYVKEDFKLKLAHDRSIRPLLEKRDEILNNYTREEKNEFYRMVVENFEALADFFPTNDEGDIDVSFLKSLKVQYLDDYKMHVVVELYENEYVENLMLEKYIHLYNEDPEATKITWKNEKGKCLLFDFLESSDDDFEGFDLLYEFYVDMLFFAELSEE